MSREDYEPRDVAEVALRVIWGLNAAYPRSFPVGADFALGVTDLRGKDPETYERIMSGAGVAFAAFVFRKLLAQSLIAGVIAGNELIDASVSPLMHRLLIERDPDGRTKAEKINDALLRERSGRFPASDECIALAREIGFEP